jgi:hypothetical protein
MLKLWPIAAPALLFVMVLRRMVKPAEQPVPRQLPAPAKAALS